MDENDAARPDLTGSPKQPESTVASDVPQGPAPAPPTYVAPPGIGIAGFACALVGLFVPLVGIVGLILSVLGYTQAKRESRPSGLALAGVIIGSLVTVLTIIVLFLLVFGTTAEVHVVHGG